MSGTVTLTRKQWNAIWRSASQVRSSASDIDIVQHALRDVGLDRPADRILQSVSHICDSASAIQRALIDAEEAMPDPQAAEPATQSNKEA